MTPTQRSLALALEVAWENPGHAVWVPGKGFRVWVSKGLLESDLVAPAVERSDFGAVYTRRRLGGWSSLRAAAEALEAGLRAEERLREDLGLGVLELARARVA
jgi:hypothetical protein